MNQLNLLYFALILGLIDSIVLAYIWSNLRALNKLKKTFFAGHSGKDLEDLLLTLSLDLKSTKDEQLVLQKHLTELKNNFQFAIQKIGVVRFNPFADTGGNLSFSMALLDGENCGVIVTNMHSRDFNRIYLKKLLHGKSETALTDEELEAIGLANTQSQIQNNQ
jgi:hypothetical protein